MVGGVGGGGSPQDIIINITSSSIFHLKKWALLKPAPAHSHSVTECRSVCSHLQRWMTLPSLRCRVQTQPQDLGQTSLSVADRETVNLNPNLFILLIVFLWLPPCSSWCVRSNGHRHRSVCLIEQTIWSWIGSRLCCRSVSVGSYRVNIDLLRSLQDYLCPLDNFEEKCCGLI